MARDLTSGLVSAITASHVRPILLFEGYFVGSVLRLWNGPSDLSWNSQTWLGNGWLEGFDGAEESVEVEANDAGVLLTGVPSSVRSLILGNQLQNGPGRLYLGALDASGAVVADPYLFFDGAYSHAELDDEPDSADVRLFYDGPLVDLERPNEGRWTHDAQRLLFSGDLGFEYVVAAANWPGTWGQGRKDPERAKPPRGGKKTGGGRRR